MKQVAGGICWSPCRPYTYLARCRETGVFVPALSWVSTAQQANVTLWNLLYLLAKVDLGATKLLNTTVLSAVPFKRVSYVEKLLTYPAVDLKHFRRSVEQHSPGEVLQELSQIAPFTAHNLETTWADLLQDLPVKTLHLCTSGELRNE